MRDIYRDLDRYLVLLRNLIRERGFTLKEVEVALGWGRSYLGSLLRKQKILRLEHVLLILNTLDVTPAAFFSELYRSGRVATRPPQAELDRLNTQLDGLVSLLEKKGVLTTTALVRATCQARQEELKPRHRCEARDRP